MTLGRQPFSQGQLQRSWSWRLLPTLPLAEPFKNFLRGKSGQHNWSTIYPLCQLSLFLHISSGSRCFCIPVGKSSKGKYRGMRLVCQTSVSGASLDLRAAINIHCLPPPWLILHFPHHPYWLTWWHDPDSANLRGLRFLALCPSQVRFTVFAHLHLNLNKEIWRGALWII